MEADEEGFWLQLMSECGGGREELPRGRRLLVLGDDDAEKALLVDRLDSDGSVPSRRRAEGSGLQYRPLAVRDEYRENQARLGVWTLDGDPFYRPLLKYAVDAASLSETLALVVASMSRPWDILDTVTSWTEILREHIEGLEMGSGELEARKGAVLERYREYVEPGLSLYGSLAADNTREIEENLGLELVVVVSQTEAMRELQSEWGYEEEHFDFIQLRLRDFCLRRGAALFYVSVREDRNCDLLLKYLLHRSFRFPFRLPGVLVERDAVLVPAGWDTRDKVRFLADTLPTIAPATPYGDVVFRPHRMLDSNRATPEVYAQGDQEFLSELLSALERPGTELPESAARGECCSSSTTTTVVQRNVARRMARGGSPQKKKRAEGADTTLSNFFHSLLNRRTSAPADRPVGMSGTRTYDSRNPDKFAAHLSLDQQDADKIAPEDGNPQQLPEYFLSHPVCSPDCSFQTESSSIEEEFGPPPDRLRSAPMRTLRERTDTPGTEEETRRSEEQTNGETRSSEEQTDRESRIEDRADEKTKRMEQTNGETRSRKEQTNRETRNEDRTDEETRSEERTHREARNSEVRIDEETRNEERATRSSEERGKKTRSSEESDVANVNGQLRLSNGETSRGGEPHETVMTPMPWTAADPPALQKSNTQN